VLGAVLLLQSPWFAKAGLLWQIPCRQAMVTAAQLQHRVPCWGYVFEETVVPTTPSGSSGSGSGSSARGRRVVLLGDTVDSRPIAPVAVGADLVSHEATFAAGMETKAALAQHSTAWMAGQFAWAIQAKALVLTHFSARYEGSKEKSKWLPQGSYEGRRGRADESDSEERTIKALQREADDQYGLGPVLLAIDLLTAHVPRQEGADAC
jgi:ribonuclease Z